MEKTKNSKDDVTDKIKNRIKKCLEINKPLVPLKVVLFCWFAAHSTLVPFITVHLKEKGLTVKDTSAIFTFLPIPLILGPPIIGMIADKIGRYKLVLLFVLGMCAILATGILFIPKIPHPECEIQTGVLSCSLSQSSTQLIMNEPCDREYNGTVMFHINKCWTNCSTNDIVEFNSCSSGVPGGKNFTSHIEPITNSTCYYSIQTLNNTFDNFSGAKNCNFTCQVQSVRDKHGNLFKNKCNNFSNERLRTLILAFVLVILFMTLLTSCFRFMDVCTLIMIKKYKGDFGRERITYSVAGAIFSPLSGYIVDLVSSKLGYTNYFPAFCLYNALIIITIINVAILKLDMAAPGRNMSKNAFHLLKQPEIWLLIFALFLLGTSWGFTESFLPWFLVDLKSPKYLIGLMSTVGHIAGIPFLLTTAWAIKKIGHVNILIITFFVYCIQLFGYSFIYNPWLVLLVGILKPICIVWMWIATVTYCGSFAPEGLLATVQSCAGGIHWGVGRGMGGLIGGNIMHAYGPRVAFQVLGVAAGMAGFFFTAAYYYVLPWCRRNQMDVTVKEPSNPEKVEKEQNSKETERKNAGSHTLQTESHQPPDVQLLHISSHPVL